MKVAEKPAFCTDPSDTNFTNILFVVDLNKAIISKPTQSSIGSTSVLQSIFTSYLVEPYSHRIRQSIVNQGYHHHELQHNHKHNCRGFRLQMTEISMPLENPLAQLYAKRILYSANIPADSLAIQVDFHFLALNRHRKQL